MSDLFDHLVVGVAAFVTVFVATPVVRWIARRTGAVAEPGERHIHTRTTPTIGGIAIFAGIIAAIAAGSRLPSFDTLFRTTNEPEAIVLASLVIVVVGMLDDTRGISAPAKVAGQVLASGVLVIFGLSLRFVYLPGSPGTIVSLNNDLAALVTIVAMVAIERIIFQPFLRFVHPWRWRRVSRMREFRDQMRSIPRRSERPAQWRSKERRR